MINPHSNPFIRDSLMEMRQLQERDRVVYYHPQELECTKSGCGHDSATNSKKKIDCTNCDARGYVTTWATQIIVARVVKPEALAFSFEDHAILAETADLILFIRKEDKDTLDRIKENERAYLQVDAVNYRPSTITAVGVTGLDEYRVSCQTYKPR